MAQVPVSVSEQVKKATQKLAREAKSYSKLTNFEIEAKLYESAGSEEQAVVSDKGGAHFSELLNGKKSKAHDLVEFAKALEKTGLLPPQPKAGDFEYFFRTDAMARTSKVTDWAAEDRKVKAFYKAREKAAAALHELAKVMDHPTDNTMFFDLLQNLQLQKAAGIEKRRTAESFPSFGSAADQIRDLGRWVGEMSVSSSSGWDYSGLKPKTGAKVVQSESDKEDRQNDLKMIKKTKKPLTINGL